MVHSEPKIAPRMGRQVPQGDDRERLVCGHCSYVVYENPKIVVGCIAFWEDRVLLCRRAISPRKGLWTLPAGYLELGETTEDGAKREAWEEARAHVELGALFSIYNLPHVSQVQLLYHATLTTPHVAAGPESEEVGLFTWQEVPWDALAFPTVRWALEAIRRDPGRVGGPPHTNPVTDYERILETDP
jgi:ADP-ribose pyrophosphatase YjhB (NUDIX family)